MTFAKWFAVAVVTEAVFRHGWWIEAALIGALMLLTHGILDAWEIQNDETIAYLKKRLEE